MAKSVSQAEFAALFNLARPSVGAYEEGRSEPKIDTLIQIANHFRLSIDVLLTRELTVNDILAFGLVKEKLNKAHKIVDSSKGDLPDPVSLVKIDDYVNYIVHYQNGDFINNLPRIAVPNEKAKNLRAFQMKGSEMEYHQQGLHHGDILVAKESSLDKVKERDIVTVITSNEIITRRVYGIKPTMDLIADDPNYDYLSIPHEDILEIWKIKSVYSHYLNPPTLLEERVLRLEKEIDQLKHQLKA